MNSQKKLISFSICLESVVKILFNEHISVAASVGWNLVKITFCDVTCFVISNKLVFAMIMINK